LKQTIQGALQLGALFRKDPAEAAVSMIQSYRGMNPWALKAETKPAAPETFVDGFGRRHSGQYLSHVIDQAMERAPAEREDYEATAAERKQLSELFGKPFDECLSILAQLDRDAIKSPEDAALRLNAMFGGPQTPQAVEAHWQAKEDRAVADQAVRQAEKVLPGMDNPVVRQTMAAAIEGGHANNLQDAHAIAVNFLQHQHQQTTQAIAWTNSQLEVIAKANLPLARAIVDTLDPKHDGFVEHIWRMDDPVARLHAAAGVATSRLDNQRSLEKAKRVKAVKSSPSVAPKSEGGMDRAIAQGMSLMKF
jgi:hypothetical protein